MRVEVEQRLKARVSRQEERIADLERELAEARKAAEWTLITPENLPKVGDLVWKAYTNLTWSHAEIVNGNSLGNSYEEWTRGFPRTLLGKYTHYYPIVPPSPEAHDDQQEVRK